MKKALIAALVGAAGLAAAVSGTARAGIAGTKDATKLPTLTIALDGVKGISLSSTAVPAGAVEITSTFSGKAPAGPDANPPSAGIARLHPGVTFQQAARAVTGHHGDLDALTPYGSLLVSAAAPSTVEAVLTPGSYVALNTTGNGEPAFEAFTVAPSPSAAALPAAGATESAIDFSFRGPAVLRDGTIVRARNDGYLVHMVMLVGVRNAATGRRVVSLLRAGREREAEKLAGHAVVNLLGPASPGAMQQQVLRTAPGAYVEVCFMDTEDNRDHAQLGMARLVRVVG